MSGIAGFFTKKQNVDVLSVLKRMLTRVKHRGSGYSGVYVSRQVALGVTKTLSNINKMDIAPLSNEDKTLWIVWSGKIFNHKELIANLLNLGHLFKTNRDDELILHLYQEYGANCLNMINGQFAFSIWNSTRNEMFLARDRVGICPLFYSSNANEFVFGSEMKAVFEYPQMTPKISSISITQALTFWTTIAPNTIFEDVYELSPGQYLTLNSSGLKINSYWTFPVFRSNDYESISFDESIEKIYDILDDAVNIRVQTEDRYGAYLSGGLDSAVTTAFIRKIYPNHNLDTFSISFDSSEYDESSYQKKAVDYYKTNHSTVICSDADIAKNFREVVFYAESILLRTAPIPMFLLSKLARKSNIKTIISGEGADEIFGGYNIFKEAIIREFWAQEPTSKYRPLLLKKLYPYLTQMGVTNDMALRMFFGYKLTETSSPVYSHLLRWSNTSRIKNLFSSELKNNVKGYNPIEELSDKLVQKFKDVDLLSRAQWLEATIFMSGYLLSSQGERMAMANSLEARYPFLDHRIIELCMKLKPEYRLKGLNEKYLLKTMMKDRVPYDILKRKKQPYRAPIASSLMAGFSTFNFNEMLSKEKINSVGFFDFDKVCNLLRKIKHTNRISEIDNMALSAVLSTQVLHSIFVEKTIPTFIDSEVIVLDNVVYDYKNNYA